MKVSDLSGVQLDYWACRAGGWDETTCSAVRRAKTGLPYHKEFVRTPLEAAMRCFVASKFGEAVPSIDELKDKPHE